MDIPLPPDFDPPLPRTARPVELAFNVIVEVDGVRHWCSQVYQLGPMTPGFAIVDTAGQRLFYVLTPDWAQGTLLPNEYASKLAALLYAYNYRPLIVVFQGQFANEVIG